MPTTRTCDFSGEQIEPGTGILYVKKDGSVLHFKDAKCEKNYFLGRKPRDVEWTAAGRSTTAGSDPDEEQEPADEATAADETSENEE